MARVWMAQVLDLRHRGENAIRCLDLVLGVRAGVKKRECLIIYERTPSQSHLLLWS